MTQKEHKFWYNLEINYNNHSTVWQKIKNVNDLRFHYPCGYKIFQELYDYPGNILNRILKCPIKEIYDSFVEDIINLEFIYDFCFYDSYKVHIFTETEKALIKCVLYFINKHKDVHIFWEIIKNYIDKPLK